MLSIIIPVVNEQEALGKSLAALQPLRRRGVEVIVVDGGSTDATLALARPLADLTLRAPLGRASQMNAGARRAQGDTFSVPAFGHRTARTGRGANFRSAEPKRTDMGALRCPVRFAAPHPSRGVLYDEQKIAMDRNSDRGPGDVRAAAGLRAGRWISRDRIDGRYRTFQIIEASVAPCVPSRARDDVRTPLGEKRSAQDDLVDVALARGVFPER